MARLKNTQMIGGIAALAGFGALVYMLWPRRAAAAEGVSGPRTVPVPTPKVNPTDQYVAQVKSALVQKALGTGVSALGTGAAAVYSAMTGGTAAVTGGAGAAAAAGGAAAGGAAAGEAGTSVAALGMSAALPIAVGAAAAVGLTLGMREVGYLITKDWGLKPGDVQAERDRWFALNPGAPYRPVPIVTYGGTYAAFLAAKDKPARFGAIPPSINTWYRGPPWPGQPGGPPAYTPEQVVADFSKAGYDPIAVRSWLDASWIAEVQAQDIGYTWASTPSLTVDWVPIAKAAPTLIAQVLDAAAKARADAQSTAPMPFISM